MGVKWWALRTGESIRNLDYRWSPEVSHRWDFSTVQINKHPTRAEQARLRGQRLAAVWKRKKNLHIVILQTCGVFVVVVLLRRK